jgi:DNA (cytosine-5)-methyltransferase 1
LITHLDLFTGIGGFHLAAEWAGLETIGFSEIEPYCCRLLAEKWSEIRNYGDIRTADFSGLRGRITVLSAGVPCQPSSLAGKRRGAQDDRWLWEAALDVVRDVEPAWCLFENPPGILSLDEFGGVLLRLESLGYEVRAFSVPANAVGAKHRRQRIFIVAHTELGNRDGRRAGWGETVGGGSRDAVIRPSADSEALADTAGARCDQRQPRESGEIRDNSRWPEFERRNGYCGFRLTEPPLCLRVNGVSSGLDGTPIRNRSAQLKALGNACVPAQCFPFFQAIYQVETCRAKAAAK